MAVTPNPAATALAWTNYTAVATSSRPPLNAYTYVAIGVPTPTIVRGSTLRVSQVTVPISVDRGRSWFVSSRQTDALLRHERLHYRIGILVARELDARLLGVTAASQSALRTALQSAIDDAGPRMQSIFESYDRDTNHALVVPQQAAWEMRVTSWEQAGRITFP